MGALTAAAILLFSASGAAAPQIEPTGPMTEAAVPAAVRASLEPKGARLTMPNGPYCDLWLRKNIPDAKNAAPGALHSELGFASAVGLIRFLTAAADFRGQTIRPGLYTLRYALHPTDGDHLGVSDYPDFLLLIPAAEDPDIDAGFKFEDLVNSSRKATGTRHPGVLSLTRPSGTSFPSVTTNALGHVVLQVKAKLRSGGEMPIALVIKGRSEQ